MSEGKDNITGRQILLPLLYIDTASILTSVLAPGDSDVFTGIALSLTFLSIVGKAVSLYLQYQEFNQIFIKLQALKGCKLRFAAWITTFLGVLIVLFPPVIRTARVWTAGRIPSWLIYREPGLIYSIIGLILDGVHLLFMRRASSEDNDSMISRRNILMFRSLQSILFVLPYIAPWILWIIFPCAKFAGLAMQLWSIYRVSGEIILHLPSRQEKLLYIILGFSIPPTVVAMFGGISSSPLWALIAIPLLECPLLVAIAVLPEDQLPARNRKPGEGWTQMAQDYFLKAMYYHTLATLVGVFQRLDFLGSWVLYISSLLLGMACYYHELIHAVLAALLLYYEKFDARGVVLMFSAGARATLPYFCGNIRKWDVSPKFDSFSVAQDKSAWVGNWAQNLFIGCTVLTALVALRIAEVKEVLSEELLSQQRSASGNEDVQNESNENIPSS